MCTVTYIPYKNGFILSSNRDESPLRADNTLTEEIILDKKVLFPKDLKGGSWLFASMERQVLCVLNGAKYKHKHRPPYRESRGIIAKSFFNHKHPRTYFQELNLDGIEPFTMIIVHENKLYEFQWNEKAKHINQLDSSLPHIWSSSTLYTAEIARKKSEIFYDFLNAKKSISLNDIKDIHRNGKVGDPEQDFVMNRHNIVCTISVSHVVVDKKEVVFEFENLVAGEHQVKKLGQKFQSLEE